jgi:hypothetical protein
MLQYNLLELPYLTENTLHPSCEDGLVNANVKIIVGYTEDHKKSINTLCWQNREFLDDKAGGVTVL